MWDVDTVRLCYRTHDVKGIKEGEKSHRKILPPIHSNFRMIKIAKFVQGLHLLSLCFSPNSSGMESFWKCKKYSNREEIKYRPSFKASTVDAQLSLKNEETDK